jgi:Protein of unknown function (DUF1045)
MSRAQPARIALYYAPPAASAWWRAGCDWLGRDPETNENTEAFAAALTQEPRRYGWHGTLVAPFRLREGVSFQDVRAAARGWAQSQARFDMPVAPVEMGHFVALQAVNHDDADTVRTLAESALRVLDSLRARPSREENEKRVTPGMSAGQVALLHEWGYPYVLDEFRFHMTLSSSLDSAALTRGIMEEWCARCDALGPMPFHGAALFVEPEAGAPFELVERLPFPA